ncbi:hypothetical protein [Streptomyces sp. Je 1-369]|uniref:hypothetical protein n=1 Tax=Streptomyces sp. Je 1-369 TaxID=2966192 RepID=UPI00228608CC|nr:hypothetical protein [Streptomyces sp. Je 1-369]WAL94609.1 hypothetical protein NOO62_08900 [Streptomyces sp. Je 1-369]
MQTIRIKSPSSDTGQQTGQGTEKDLLPLLAGAAVAVGGVGAVLALIDLSSPLRGPFTLFFLLAAPGAAIGAALRALTPWGRAVASVSGAMAVNLLVAQGMLALHVWSVRGGVVAVAVLSSLILLLTAGQRLRHRAAKRWTS